MELLNNVTGKWAQRMCLANASIFFRVFQVACFSVRRPVPLQVLWFCHLWSDTKSPLAELKSLRHRRAAKSVPFSYVKHLSGSSHSFSQMHSFNYQSRQDFTALCWPCRYINGNTCFSRSIHVGRSSPLKQLCINVPLLACCSEQWNSCWAKRKVLASRPGLQLKTHKAAETKDYALQCIINVGRNHMLATGRRVFMITSGGCSVRWKRLAKPTDM